MKLRSGPGGALGAVLLASFLLKLVVGGSVLASGDPERFVQRDSVSYLRTARALLEHGVFASSPESPEVPETFRTPGYPLFVAAALALSGGRVEGVVLAGILTSLLSVAGVFYLAAERFGRRAGLVAALLLLTDVVSFAYSLQVMSETLFTALVLASVVCAYRFRKSPRLGWVLGCGVCLAASVQVRPLSYYLVAPIAVWVAVVAFRSRHGLRSQHSLRRAAVAVGVVILPWVVLVGGWHWRNQALTGESLFSRVAGTNLLFYRAAAVVALRDGIGLEEARHRLGRDRYEEVHPETAGASPERLAVLWEEEGKAILWAHPYLFLQVQLRSLPHFLIGLGHHTLFQLLGIPVPEEGPLGDLLRLDGRTYLDRWVFGRTGSWLAFVAEQAHLLVLYAGVLLWGIWSWRQRRLDADDVAAWLVLGYLVAVTAGPEAYARFRVPLVPLLAVYSAAGFVAAFRPRPASPDASTR